MTATLTDAQAAQLREAAQKMSDEQFPLLRELILALLDRLDAAEAAERTLEELRALDIEHYRTLQVSCQQQGVTDGNRIVAAEAERDALRAERDEARELLAEFRDHAHPYQVARAESAEADAARLRKALEEARTSMRNARGAIESNQVVDKDVHGTLAAAIQRINAALTTKGTAE